ncbi:hypothetical protein [Pseudonocardia asaccharolytica]|nr:hypothetical protein [Pseudonocardia asaccharolytica]
MINERASGAAVGAAGAAETTIIWSGAAAGLTSFGVARRPVRGRP